MSVVVPEKFTDLSDANTFTFPTDSLEYEQRRKLRNTHEIISGVNGVFNFYRGEAPPLDVWQISVRWKDIQASAGALDTQLDDIASKLYKAGKLWFLYDDSSRRFVYAELEELPLIRIGPGQARHVPIIAKFIGFGDKRDENETTGTESSIASSPDTFNITNPGNAYVYDAVFTLTALSNNGFTNPKLENLTTGESIETTRDSAATNDELIIDCGKGTVKFNGSDDFSLVTIGATQRPFISLAPGVNNMRLTIGGTPDLDFDYAFRGAWLS